MLIAVERDGSWFVSNEEGTSRTGPFNTFEEAMGWITQIRPSRLKVSADKINVLLAEAGVEQSAYLAVKIAEGVETGDLLQ